MIFRRPGVRQQIDRARTKQVAGFGAALRLPGLQAQARENRAAVVSLPKVPQRHFSRQEIAARPDLIDLAQPRGGRVQGEAIREAPRLADDLIGVDRGGR